MCVYNNRVYNNRNILSFLCYTKISRLWLRCFHDKISINFFTCVIDINLRTCIINTSNCSRVFIVSVHSLLFHVRIRFNYMTCSLLTCREEPSNFITCMILKPSHGLVTIIIEGVRGLLNYELHLWSLHLHSFPCQLHLIVYIWNARSTMSVIINQMHCLTSLHLSQ